MDPLWFGLFAVFVALALLLRPTAVRARVFGAPTNPFAALTRWVPDSGVLAQVPYIFRLSAHVANLFLFRLKRAPPAPFERQDVDLADGGVIALDWTQPLDATAGPDAPIVAFVPGLTGSSKAPYVLSAIDLLRRTFRRVRCVVVNYRGCAGTPLRTPRLYCAADTGDLSAAVAAMQRRYASAPLQCLVGYSLGSVLVVRYAAETGDKCPFRSAVSVSNPWDFNGGAKALLLPVNRWLYNLPLARDMRRIFRKHSAVLAKSAVIDAKRALSGRTIADFDAAVTAPTFGFASVGDYYTAASSAQHIGRVRVPLMCINALDDPFTFVKHLPVKEVHASRCAFLVVTDCGGHLAFPQCRRQPFLPAALALLGMQAHSIADTLIAEFISAMQLRSSTTTTATGAGGTGSDGAK